MRLWVQGLMPLGQRVLQLEPLKMQQLVQQR
jgi:hypothetical protein